MLRLHSSYPDRASGRDVPYNVRSRAAWPVTDVWGGLDLGPSWHRQRRAQNPRDGHRFTTSHQSVLCHVEFHDRRDRRCERRSLLRAGRYRHSHCRSRRARVGRGGTRRSTPSDRASLLASCAPALWSYSACSPARCSWRLRRPRPRKSAMNETTDNFEPREQLISGLLWYGTWLASPSSRGANPRATTAPCEALFSASAASPR